MKGMVEGIVTDMFHLPIGKIAFASVAALVFSGCTNTYKASSIGALPTPEPFAQSQVLGVVDQKEESPFVEDDVNASSRSAQIVTPPPTAEPEPIKQVVLKTSKGDIVIELFPQDAPKTTENFLKKTQSKTYNSRIFHRVENWVIQGGDPMKNGTGGGEMETELSSRPFTVGSVGVARGGNIRISNSDQFFICTDDCSWLTGQYTQFGKVTKGLDVAKKIQIGDTILEIVPVTQKKSGRSS